MGQEPVPHLTAVFYFYDARGVDTSAFPTGQSFYMGFVARNNSDKVLTYNRGDASPDVIFSIMQGDSVVCTSIDGYAFIQVPSVVQLLPKDAMLGWWVAPNTPAREPKLVLAPGQYEARVRFRRFNNAEINQPSPKPFTIY